MVCKITKGCLRSYTGGVYCTVEVYWNMNTFVCYYRVSTQKQGQSGLGLEGQRATVQKFCAEGRIIGEFTDVESGKKDNRPELLKAIEAAKQHGATLVIAKLDRLSRSRLYIPLYR